MKFQYFKAGWDTTIEEAKRQYHKLVVENHPDLGGSDEALTQINLEWDYLKAHNFNVHESMSGSVYTDENQDMPDEVTQRFDKIINALIALDGVGIEICGSFIWLSGETYQWKELLKGLGFKWARKKKRWFLAPQRKGKRNNDWSMERIRARHGSLVVTEAPKRRETMLLTA